MKRTSITNAKNRLSSLLDQVRHGETIIIEDRGVPIAQVSPIGGGAATPDRDRLARLERQGILRPSWRTGSKRPGVTPPLRARRQLALTELVRLERGEGW